MTRETSNQRGEIKTHGAERGLSRFEGFSDAVFAIALTLLIVEIKVPGSPEGRTATAHWCTRWPSNGENFSRWLSGETGICAYWLQHHYSGRIYSKSDHWFGVLNLLFLLAIVVIPYPIRIWCFHLGTAFEHTASITLTSGLALTACTGMGKWFYGLPGRRMMDERLRPDFLRQMTRRFGMRDADPDRLSSARDRSAPLRGSIPLLCITFFLLPQPKPRYKPGEGPRTEEKLAGYVLARVGPW